MDPQRRLYEKIGPVRYCWWSMCVSAALFVRRDGVHAGFRWWLYVVLAWLGGLAC